MSKQELEILEQMSKAVCPACKGSGHGTCCIENRKAGTHHHCLSCNGVGRKWPGFSTICPNPLGAKPGWAHHGPCDTGGTSKWECPDCQGSGRVPVSVAEAVLWGMEWLKSQRYGIEVACFRAEHGWHCIIFGPRDGKDRWDGKGETVPLALYAAMKEEAPND